MDTKHTPGPWEAIGNIVRDVPRPTERGGMSGGYLVAETAVQDSHRYANARLIAAAPDMLAALEQMIALHAPAETRFPSLGDTPAGRAYAAACAAVSKAREEGR